MVDCRYRVNGGIKQDGLFDRFILLMAFLIMLLAFFTVTKLRWISDKLIGDLSGVIRAGPTFVDDDILLIIRVPRRHPDDFLHKVIPII